MSNLDRSHLSRSTMLARALVLLALLALPAALRGQWQSAQPVSGELPAERMVRMQAAGFEAMARMRAKAPILMPNPRLVPPLGNYMTMPPRDQKAIRFQSFASAYITQDSATLRGARDNYLKMMQWADSVSFPDYLRQMASAIYLNALVRYPEAQRSDIESCLMQLHLSGYREAHVMALGLKRVWHTQPARQHLWEEIRQKYLVQAQENLAEEPPAPYTPTAQETAAALTLPPQIREAQRKVAEAEAVYEQRKRTAQQQALDILKALK